MWYNEIVFKKETVNECGFEFANSNNLEIGVFDVLIQGYKKIFISNGGTRDESRYGKMVQF